VLQDVLLYRHDYRLSRSRSICSKFHAIAISNRLSRPVTRTEAWYREPELPGAPEVLGAVGQEPPRHNQKGTTLPKEPTQKVLS
jgi:hypothetical protein